MGKIGKALGRSDDYQSGTAKHDGTSKWGWTPPREERMKTKIYNITPHVVTIIQGERSIEVNPCILAVPRCTQTSTQIDTIQLDGIEIPVKTCQFGEVEDLPEPEPGAIFIVSQMVANAAKDRRDLFFPGELVRDDAGKIIGCACLMQAPLQ